MPKNSPRRTSKETSSSTGSARARRVWTGWRRRSLRMWGARCAGTRKTFLTCTASIETGGYMAEKERQDSPGLCRVPAARQGPGQLVAHETERLFGLASSRMGSAGLGPFSKRGAEEAPLRVSPMTPFPDSVAVGGGTALLLDGNCSHPSGSLEQLWVAVGDREVE